MELGTKNTCKGFHNFNQTVAKQVTKTYIKLYIL